MQLESKLVCRDEQEAHYGLNMKSPSLGLNTWYPACGDDLGGDGAWLAEVDHGMEI